MEEPACTNLNSSQIALATLISTSSRINTSHPTGNLMTEKPCVRRRESWHFIYRISASPVQRDTHSPPKNYQCSG
ncbi:Aspercryptin biosynthesis cluster-specific transcription regulator atnN [Fusarium oxysporum f. sp. albedinis]|nr:Aspercryptin biosynthesis cluster-specific transcription regulator atnN [Fusarium oxysporum f. sp. albedinis]